MPLEQSPEYLRKLAEVRALPQESERERREKHDAAANLRMEVLLDNAKCARLMVDTLLDNPQISIKELQALVGREANVIHPEVTEIFAKEMKDTGERVRAAVRDLKRESQEKRTGMAKLFYRRLLTSELRTAKPALPQGKVKLGGEFPLAVQLEVESETDYLALRYERLSRATSPENLKQGRGYNKVPAKAGTLGAILEELAGNYVDYPVIVVRPGTVETSNPLVRMHERGHAQHAVFETALEKSGKKFIWGEPEWDAGVDNWRLQELWDKDEDKARNSDYWKRIQQHACAAAKREFFAEMTASGGKRLDADFMNMMQFGPYDYFKAFGIEPGTPLHKALRKEYLETIESAASRVANITRGYSAVGLTDRSDLIRWAAAQMPLEEWSRQFAGANFQWEANRLRRIFRFYSATLQREGSSLGTELELEKERQKRLMDQMSAELKQNQDKPLDEILSRYEGFFAIPENFA